MTDRHPPLTALRAFEAAARHLSFARAAEELNVTPAALSFQIRSLEDHLGRPVFRRHNRAITLTDTGHALLPGLAEGFGALNAAWRAALHHGRGRTLTVTAGPAFTARWLAPRFFDFARAHPDIELRFSASLHFVDMAREDVDVALRFTSRPDSGVHSVTLFRDWVTPMMAPELAARITAPAHLTQAVLLHQDDVVLRNPPLGWSEWFRAEGLGTPPQGGPRFSQSDHAIDAAVSGAGVVLGRASLAQHALRAGQLVAPFDLALTNGVECRFLCARGAETRPEIATFLDWIRGEVAAMDPLTRGRRFVPVSELPL